MISPGLFIPPADNPFAMKPQPDLPGLLLKEASPEFLTCLAAGVEMKVEMRGNCFIMSTVPKCAVADMGDGTKRVFVLYEQPARETPSRSFAPLG